MKAATLAATSWEAIFSFYLALSEIFSWTRRIQTIEMEVGLQVRIYAVCVPLQFDKNRRRIKEIVNAKDPDRIISRRA